MITCIIMDSDDGQEVTRFQTPEVPHYGDNIEIKGCTWTVLMDKKSWTIAQVLGPTRYVSAPEVILSCCKIRNTVG